MSYSIDTSGQFVRVTYSGTLEISDIQGVVKDSLKIVDGHEDKFINRIEDIRAVTGIKIGFDDLMHFTEGLRTFQMPRTVKTALLTGNTLQYGVARMFQSVLTHQQMNIKVFSHEEDALNWLSEKE